jgi:hypothetical protein
MPARAVSLGRALGTALASALLAAGAAGCVILVSRVKGETVDQRADSVRVETPVRAHLLDGTAVTYADGVLVLRGALLGDGVRHDLVRGTTSTVSRVLVDSILGVEAYRNDYDVASSVIFSALGNVAIIAGGIALACVADPKCFGSCPTIYHDSLGTPVLEAEAFSYSISPLFEARDVDRLRARPDANGVLRLEVWNEALETHYINHLEVLEVRHAPGDFAVPDERARPVVTRAFAAPRTAHDRAGRDVAAVLAAADGRVFATDTAALGRATEADLDDHLELLFPRPTGAADSVALVLRLRNSLLNTVLFYDMMLAAPGARSLDWLGRDLTRIGDVLELGQWYGARGGLRVSVPDGDGWREVARAADQGPIAWRDLAFVLPAPAAGDVRLRVSFVADGWRIDRAALAALAPRPAPRHVPLTTVTAPSGTSEQNALAGLAAPDEHYLRTTPRQRFVARFDVGGEPADSARTFFLVAQGYYTEWVRGAWLAGAGDTTTFRPTDAALLATMQRWRSQRDSMEAQFHRSRIPVQ